LHHALIDADMTSTKLARKLGYSAAYLRLVFSGKKCKPARQAIEDELGAAIWTPAREFKIRQKRKEKQNAN